MDSDQSPMPSSTVARSASKDDRHKTVPTLATQRLVLRPFGHDHLTAEYIAWLNDPDVVRFSEQRHRAHDLQSCREYQTRMTAPGRSFWAIERKDGRHIGNISATEDEPNNVAELAIMIGDKASWGTGFGTEAWSAAIEYLLFTKAVRKLVAGAMSVNTPMLSIFRRTAMQLEGTRARYFLWQGTEVDLLEYSRFADGKNDKTGTLSSVDGGCQ